MTPPASIVHNCDCMTFMRTLPDKAFDLAICDPPYGIGEDGLKNHSRGCIAKSREYTPKDWDKSAPDKAVFDEIIRVSRNQIIFGANHFIDRIPYPSSCWIVWDKENGATDFADCELAWTSFPTAVRKFAFGRNLHRRSCYQTNIIIRFRMIDKTFFENPPHICEHCKNCIIPKAGFMKGKILCVCDDKKNPKVPHVHATQLHFKCSTNQFENKYV